MTTHRKKLIEVALPLGEINDASAYDKMPGIGAHPKGIHHWWARLPLPTARAVLFASVVDDPTSDPRFADKSQEEQDAERERLFGIIRKLMTKKMHEHPEIYAEALKEMERCCEGKLPEVLDPFAGGGSIPLEAHRMGFKAHASDLNPVAVLINKACLEIVPRWLNHPPVHPEARKDHVTQDHWRGAAGLAEDVRRYGADILKQAKREIGHLYPKAKLPKELGGGEAEVIAWIWARTIQCPNPSCGHRMPMIRSFELMRKKGKRIFTKPQVDRKQGRISFTVEKEGTPEKETTSGKGSRCIFCDTALTKAEVRDGAKEYGVEEIPYIVVAEGTRGRIYLPGTRESHPKIDKPDADAIDQPMTNDRRWFSPPLYGLPNYRDIFAPRQLTGLTTLSKLVSSISAQVSDDAIAAGLSEANAAEYSVAIATFLSFSIDRCADFNNSLCRWSPSNEKVMNLFGRQAIPMAWDFAEANLFGSAVGSFSTCKDYVATCIDVIPAHPQPHGSAIQQDATQLDAEFDGKLLISTDPPYYDNIGYAVLSDFFYVWLRHTIGKRYPELFSTVLVPKLEELTAIPARFDGNKLAAKNHFESGFREAFDRFRQAMDPRFPLTVYYAFKQSDEEAGKQEGDDEKVTLTTGWETLLEALITSGFQITATWPVRASQQWRMVSMGTNALASYIVLACRPRDPQAPSATRHNFRQALQNRLPDAVRKLQFANIAPVDLAQASIGPGMAIYSAYSKVVESDGERLSVRTALQIINQVLGETLDEQENDFDADTRWAVTWFRQHGFEAGPYGSAEELAVAQAISVQGLVEGGILFAKGGKARLLRNEELQAEWNPETDNRISIWECTAHLVRALKQGGESRAATLLASIHRRSGLMPPAIKELAYLLFQTCEKKGWAKDALGFNALVTSWPSIEHASQDVPKPTSDQGELEL